MTEDKPYLPGPEADERAVVEEMIRDPDSKHWEECNEFVKQRVYAKAKNIPNDFLEEISQEAMYKVARALPGFQFHCAFKTWLNPIIENCIIDMYRRLRKERNTTALEEPSNDDDRQDEPFPISEAETTEEAFMIKEDLRNALAALVEYTNAHSNSDRNRLIIRMVLFEEHTHAETAKAAGCNPPVVSYVIRQAQRYARERKGHKP